MNNHTHFRNVSGSRMFARLHIVFSLLYDFMNTNVYSKWCIHPSFKISSLNSVKQHTRCATLTLYLKCSLKSRLSVMFDLFFVIIFTPYEFGFLHEFRWQNSRSPLSFFRLITINFFQLIISIGNSKHFQNDIQNMCIINKFINSSEVVYQISSHWKW